MNEPAKPTIPCKFPWDSAYISPNGDVRHCCSTNLNRIGTLKENTLEEIWNGPLYQKIRKHVAAGEFDKAFCSPTCEGLRSGEGYPWSPLQKGAPAMEANQRRGEENFRRGAEHADHLPLHLCVEFSDACNFRCVMCLYDFIPPYNSVPKDGVDQVLKMAKYANRVALMGGEVFANKPDLRFLSEYDPPEGGRMGFITNASRLDDAMLEFLTKFKRIDMTISIDGFTKETFEKIRVRGRFELVDANIRRMVAKSHEVAALGHAWNVRLGTVVMRSNLADLANAVRYAAALGIAVEFGPVKGFHLIDENIFIYQDTLEATGDWRGHMAAAHKALEEAPADYAHKDVVARGLNLIQEYLDRPKMRVYPGLRAALKRLIRSDKDLGHVFGLYFDWRHEGVPLTTTVHYATIKVMRRLSRKLALGPKRTLAHAEADVVPAP
ncbi:MAG: SPASM domain-containing protein [Elusimicrobia bacterium]|nr:SPASM domain-containing protein [Elusimicrobiota bacterium]